MNINHGLVTIKGETFEVSEDEKRIYFTEISNRKIKAHFTISKDKEANKKAEYAMKAFWTEVYRG